MMYFVFFQPLPTCSIACLLVLFRNESLKLGRFSLGFLLDGRCARAQLAGQKSPASGSGPNQMLFCVGTKLAEA